MIDRGWRGIALMLLLAMVGLGCNASGMRMRQAPQGATSAATGQAGELPAPQSAGGVDWSARPRRQLPIQSAIPVGKLADGSILAWRFARDNADLPAAIYQIKTDATVQPLVRPRTKAAILFDVAFEGDTLYWVETDDTPEKANWQIWARNVATGTELEIDHGRLRKQDVPTQTSTLFAPKLAVDGSRLVWSTFEPDADGGAIAVVRLYDMATAKSEILDTVRNTRTDEFGHPRISGQYVVYDQGRIDSINQGRQGTILLYDLATHQKRVLAEGLDAVAPDIAGSHVVWMAGRHDIKLHDLRTGETRVVVWGREAERWQPRVTDQFVVWLHTADLLKLLPLRGAQEVTTLGVGLNGGAVAGPFLYWFSPQAPDEAVTHYIDLTENGG